MSIKFMSKYISYSIAVLLISILGCSVGTALERDAYDDVMKRGTLRHIGVPYAHFVTGSGDGLDVELVKLFSEYLGVRYEYVPSTWTEGISELVGYEITPSSKDITLGKRIEIRGDIMVNGLTILPWREKVLTYSIPTFPSGVWLVARADNPRQPIVPSGDLEKDIQATIALVDGCDVLAIPGGCLDPALNHLQDSNARIKLLSIKNNLNELIPKIIQNEAQCTLIDVPDALIGIQKWSGRIKVLGPLSMNQEMGAAFAKSSVKLRDAFNAFFLQCVKEGVYHQLLKKYYPSVTNYFPAFFNALDELAQSQKK